MATATLNCFKKLFQFTVNSATLSTKCITSPAIEVGGVKWKVKFSKRPNGDDENKHAVDVELVGMFNGIEKYSCEAQAAFKLLNVNGQGDKSVVKSMSKKIFDEENSFHGIDGLIDWENFLEVYVNNNEATFEIEIFTGPLKRERNAQCDVNQVAAELNVTIKNAKNLGSCYSPEVVLRGIRWDVLCEKAGEFVGVFLCGEREDMDTDWYYEVDCKFKFLSFKNDIQPTVFAFTHKYSKVAERNWGFNSFKLSEFIDSENGYIACENIANLFVEMKVSEPKPMWTIPGHSLLANTSLECIICFDLFPSGKIFSTKCGHLFCKPCFDKLNADRKKCAACQEETCYTALHPIYFLNSTNISSLYYVIKR